MRKQFDIKYKPQIESGEYKVFACEHETQEARIICWDNKGDYPIIALVDNEPEKFDKYGRVPGGNRGKEFNLFIVTPEEEMSGIEKRLIKFYNDRNSTPCNKDGMFNKHDLDELLHNTASELLAIAKEELFMSEAVEGEVINDNRGNNVVRAGVFNKNFEYGDKVRIIVCKKED